MRYPEATEEDGPLILMNKLRPRRAFAVACITLAVCSAATAQNPAPRPAPAAPVSSESALPPSDSVEINVTPDGVSLFALSADAHTLFTRLAKATGLKLIVDDSIKRTITVNFVDKPVMEIMRGIVAGFGLAFREVNGIYIVSEGIPTSPSSYLLSDIDAIRTQYVPAPSAKSLLPVFLQDHVKTNAEQNSVILSAPPDVLRKFRQDIAQFDIPAAQIMIDVLMVELTDTGAAEFALRWDWTRSGKSITADSPVGEVIFRSLSTLPSGFNADLHALVTKGMAKVRANPRIATISGQAASIFIGKQRYLSTPVSIGSDNYGRQSNFIDAGVRLNMTPWTGGEGEIIVDIRPEISVLSAPDPKTNLPYKSTRRANTTVHVRDGETIIIGGLLQHETISTKTKVPILGDLPLIGSAFRSKSEQESSTDMVIFITPRILSQTGHLPGAEEEELKARVSADEALAPEKK